MPKQVLFVQGGGEGAHDEWDDKLVASLGRKLGTDYRIRYPRMPDESDPRYAPWKAALQTEWTSLGDGAILVGHSIGGTILINALAEDPPRSSPAAVFLVAPPFVGAGGWPSDEIPSMSDIGTRLPARMPIYLYHGSEDRTVPAVHVELYAKAIPWMVKRELVNRDHQLNDDLSEVAIDVLRH